MTIDAKNKSTTFHGKHPDKFHLTNPQWQPFVESVVCDIQEELGLVDQKLKAQLYSDRSMST
ncbi:hypothetical protein NZK35_14325 [Stieleria sp. ICT_E10.1]|uniref:hypothetical protein n=1 Tax=Stieleria sedimenti TaxID=2976331 RepID=UPI0021803278|nr:hypothetical protein [Stieleria sedimenti]MCS7467825.1 hypothetical protein [Stieleria sedimenti]